MLVAAADTSVVGTFNQFDELYVIKRQNLIECVENCGAAPEDGLQVISMDNQNFVFSTISIFMLRRSTKFSVSNPSGLQRILLL